MTIALKLSMVRWLLNSIRHLSYRRYGLFPREKVWMQRLSKNLHSPAVESLDAVAIDGSPVSAQ